ncbi:MAG: FkbM family methyltransferase, partial [Candidatus Margulisbacteria bacterium]|nr:FkbM family methyltransferase [Candidatus Margulisiibacteriota bacterium]
GDNIFNVLQKTAELNGNKIIPVPKGLGASEAKLPFYIDKHNSGANSLRGGGNQFAQGTGATIAVTTLDNFVAENHLRHVDFIKADIEGAERDLLKGATQTLKKFAPKLALCTYHLPDDKQVLEKLILDANPNYTVRHLRHKLFAAVINKT